MPDAEEYFFDCCRVILFVPVLQECHVDGKKYWSGVRGREYKKNSKKSAYAGDRYARN
jgi:hypothetical protein